MIIIMSKKIIKTLINNILLDGLPNLVITEIYNNKKEFKTKKRDMWNNCHSELIENNKMLKLKLSTLYENKNFKKSDLEINLNFEKLTEEFSRNCYYLIGDNFANPKDNTRIKITIYLLLNWNKLLKICSIMNISMDLNQKLNEYNELIDNFNKKKNITNKKVYIDKLIDILECQNNFYFSLNKYLCK